jgi:uroporphyrinogen decarboxylase
VVTAETGWPATHAFADIDVDRLRYIEPHDARGVTNLLAFPDWHWDTLRLVRDRAPDISLHGEVFSPVSQIMELVGPMEGALALALDPGKLRAALQQLTLGTVELALGHIRAGADAILISSAFAGAGFMSPAHYEQFVLPCERAVVSGIKRAHPAVPVYTHTCGAIGDRLELMAATGTDGIDTLDPPPLGNVDLADARRRLGGRVFIKGNVDPVNVVLRGTAEMCYQDARERIAIAGRGGYVLSTACSVPPHAPPANVLALTRAALDAGGLQ